MRRLLMPFVWGLILLFGACSPATSSEPEAAAPTATTPPPVSQADPADPAEEEVADCGATNKKYPASRFNEAIHNLANSPYKYKVLSLEEVPKKLTLLNSRMMFLNRIRTKRKEPIIDTLTMNGIVTMRQARIRGTVAVSGNTFPRAEVEEWEFRSEECVAEALGTITRIRHLIPWDKVSKTPMEYWQKGNKLFFLVPGGFYMLDEAAALQEILKKEA